MYRVSRPAIYAVLIFFFILEETVLSRISVHNVLPDTIMIFVVFCGLFCGMRIGIEVGVVSGFMKDILGIGVFGSHILMFSIVGFICGALSDKVYKENFLAQFLIVFLVMLFVSGLYISQSIYTAILTPVVFFLLEGVLRPEQII